MTTDTYYIFYYYWGFFICFLLFGHALWHLVPWPGTEPTSLALEARSVNHWTTRKWSRSVVSDFLCPMDCSLPGSSIHGIFQARVLEWGAISFSRGSSWLRDWTWVSHTVGRRLTVWAIRDLGPQEKSLYFIIFKYLLFSLCLAFFHLQEDHTTTFFDLSILTLGKGYIFSFPLLHREY